MVILRWKMDRKQWILDAATECFSEYGYKGTSVEQVAKRANVGKGTIYTYFKNKEELLQVIMMRVVQRFELSLEKNVVAHVPFHENAQQVLKDFLKFQKENALTFQLFKEMRELKTAEVVTIVQEFEDCIVALLKKQLNVAVQNGEIVACNLELTAFLTYHMYLALVAEWSKRHKPLTDEEISKVFQLFFCGGLMR